MYTVALRFAYPAREYVGNIIIYISVADGGGTGARASARHWENIIIIYKYIFRTWRQNERQRLSVNVA